MQKPHRYPNAFDRLFAARREFDELRLGLFRGLAAWTAGDIEFEAIVPAIDAYEAGHTALIRQIHAHSDVKREATPSLASRSLEAERI
jgi:hypothetical protein